MIKLIDILSEVGEGTAPKYSWTFEGDYDTTGILNLDYEFVTDSHTRYFVKLTVAQYKGDEYEMMVAFGVGRSAIKKAFGDKSPFTKIVNKGELYRVMATVVDIVKDGIKRCAEKDMKIKYLLFKPEKEKETKKGYITNDQRNALYKAYVDKNLDLVQSTKVSPLGGIVVTLK